MIMNASALFFFCCVVFSATYCISLVDALTVSDIPNGDRVYVNGHYWRDVSMPTWRGSSLSAGPSNQFMTDLAAASTWSALCAMDSDNDGYTNGEELGDPSCAWTSSSSSPARVNDITHPGLWSSVPLKSTFSAKSQSAFTGTCSAASSTVHTNQQERNAMRSNVVIPPGTKLLPENPNELVNYPHHGVTNYSAYGGSVSNIYEHDSNSCPHLQSGLKMWHDASTWGGSVPSSKTNVNIPANSKVLIRACSVSSEGYNRITIPSTSELIIDDAPVHLRVKDLIIESGGKLLLGSAKCRIQNPVTIEFFAKKSEISTYSNGIRASNGATVELWGAEQDRTWSRLKTTAFAGADFLVVQNEVEWSVGDEVIIATSIYSDFNIDQNEIRRIVRADPDKKTFQIDRPLMYKHYGGKEYQVEVGLLSRSVLFRSDPDRDVYEYGGHVEVMGSSSTFRAVGVLSREMGQRNIEARYPFHFHLLGATGGARSCFIGNAVQDSHYRAFVIHETNYSLARLNVAVNTTAAAFYYEDGTEFFNRLEFNLGVRAHTVGAPAAGGAQDGDTLKATADRIHPQDSTATIFYFSGANWNSVYGNAASGGWAGYTFLALDNAQGLAISNPQLKHIVPKQTNFEIFEYNSCHSSGNYGGWGAQGCIYFGGKLWRDSSNTLTYSNGRYSQPTKNHDGSEGWALIKNTVCFLTNRCFSSWGDRVDIVKMEVHDSLRTAVLFGESSVKEVIYNGNTPNRPDDMLNVPSQWFEKYDVSVRTHLLNMTARNIWPRPGESYWDRSYFLSSIDHSDIFKNSQINSIADIQVQNVDRNILVRPYIRKTGAYFMTNYIDHFGLIRNEKNCHPQILTGSDLSWWNVSGSNCKLDTLNKVWSCDQLPGRDVVSLDIDLPGITVDDRSLDLMTDRDTGEYSAADLDRLMIGHVSQFGSTSDRKMRSTRNHHLVTGISGIGWYFWTYAEIGIPTTIKIYPRNFIRGSRILFAMSYPAGTTFTITSEAKWGSKNILPWKPLASRQAVVNSNGTYYHFDGKHLYLQLNDYWSKNDYSKESGGYFFGRDGFFIPGDSWKNWWITVVANCPTKNSKGNCATPATADPPADYGLLPVTVCTDSHKQLMEKVNICPNEQPCSPEGSGYGFETCDEYEAGYKCWNTNYCSCVCSAECARFAPYPYSCSRNYQAECNASKKPAPIDYCAPHQQNPLNDICFMSFCNESNTQSTSRPFIGIDAPCTMIKAASDSRLGHTEGRCFDNKCVPPSGEENKLFDFFVTQLTVDEHRENVPERITVSVTPNMTKFGTATVITITKVEALYFASIDAPSSTQQRSLILTRGTSSTNWYTAATPSGIRPARNVTIRVWAQQAGSSSSSLYSTHVFTDWNAASNRNPTVEIIDADKLTSLSNLKLKIAPLDFVDSVTLVPCGSQSSSGSIVGSRTGADEMMFDASSLQTNNGCARVDLSMHGKINLKIAITLPCLGHQSNGASCKVSRMYARRRESCSVNILVTGNSHWFNSQLASASLRDGIEVTDLTVIDGDTTCDGGATICNAVIPRASWTIWRFSGKIRSVYSPRTIEIKLSDGSKEYYLMQIPSDANPHIASCINGTEPTNIVEDTPSVSGKCCNRRCLRLDPVTDADPICATTATSTTTSTSTSTTVTTSAPTTTSTVAATTSMQGTTDAPSSSPSTSASAPQTTASSNSPQTTTAAAATTSAAAAPTGTTPSSNQQQTTTAAAAPSSSPSSTTSQQQAPPTTTAAGTAMTTTSAIASTTSQPQQQMTTSNVPDATTITSGNNNQVQTTTVEATPQQQASSSSTVAPTPVPTQQTQQSTPVPTQQTQQPTAAPTTTTTVITTSTPAPTTTTTSEPKRRYAIVFKISLSATIVSDILSAQNANIRTALKNDISSLLKISALRVDLLSGDEGVSIDANSGEVAVHFEIAPSDLNAAVGGDAPVINLQAGSDATWMTNTAPIFKTNAPANTGVVSFSTVSAAAVSTATTTSTPQGGNPAPAHCFINNDCTISIIVMAASGLVLLVVVVVLVRRKRSNSSIGSSRRGKSSAPKRLDDAGYAEEVNMYGSPTSANGQQQPHQFGATNYQQYTAPTGVNFEADQELVDYAGGGGGSTAAVPSAVSAYSNNNKGNKKKKPQQRREIVLDSDDDLLEADADAFLAGLEENYENL